MPQIDRQLLGDAGLAVDEETYVRAVADIGAGPLTNEPVRDSQRDIVWHPDQFWQDAHLLRPLSLDLAEHSNRWLKLLSDSDKRVLIEGRPVQTEGPDLSAVSRILNHPAAGAYSVAIGIAMPHIDLKWQWPMRVAAFSDQIEALAELRTSYPST